MAATAAPAPTSSNHFSNVDVTVEPGTWCLKNDAGSNANRLELDCHHVQFAPLGDSVSVIMPNANYHTTVTNGSAISSVTAIRGNWMHAEVDRAKLANAGDSVTQRGNGIQYVDNAGWTLGVDASDLGTVAPDVTIDIDYSAPAA